MIEDTLKKLESRLAASENLPADQRAALEALIDQLREEIAALSDREQADSIAGFSEASAREALRERPDAELLNLSLTGLRRAVRDFEASHPRLTAVVNDLCHQLSNLGI